MAYDATTNLFLPGNHVVLTQLATQCLTDFSLDFERTNADANGPNLTVNSITVDGQPATFTFVQPTYPGDPNGQDDPDPLAHAAGVGHVVSGTNPNPPACTPQGSSAALIGTQCPANKLVITPATPIPSGATFQVTVNYTGAPGVHVDGDNSTEGWFRNNNPVGDGGFVTTEPAGTEDWMPLNDHPSAKPTYDFFDTVTPGRTVVANGRLIGFVDNAPRRQLPHRLADVALAVGRADRQLPGREQRRRVRPQRAHRERRDLLLRVAGQLDRRRPRRRPTQAIMDQQEDISAFQSLFNGTFPFATNGIVVGIPSASFEEEMQSQITFAGGTIDLPTLNHENMHQWWGDNVSEAGFELTFFKEGFARLGEYLAAARTAATTAGGLGTPAGDAAFDASLVSRFNTNYGTGSSTLLDGRSVGPGARPAVFDQQHLHAPRRRR